MTLKDFFVKDINRPIETVIKADDQDNVYQEVSEYVVTQEISKKIRNFFSSYNDYTGANGVWISGFFGSGKSHLLKILSYILENTEYDGERLGEAFAAKITDDDILKADVLRATKIPSESILYNIDQQAQITSKQQEDAILSVFYKVFFDHLGYFGSQRHVAEFEYWLDHEGVYANFKTLFNEKHGESWEKARKKYFSPKVKEGIDTVLTELLGPSDSGYRDIIDTLRKDNVMSIEDFGDKVKAYIDTKPKGFRLNFFVDEVGQYISDNTKLMTNLQTVAETLATKAKGQAWILVTSQEDMDKVIGDMDKRQKNDFSKIQARFKIPIPLTSANVDEVIEKRLLDKNEQATDKLNAVWSSEKSNIETILTFSELGIQFSGYKSGKDFINKFPFVPYQFDLFQQCIRALSNHNVFQGKHASVGERSMLGVFQDVVNRLGDQDEKALVTFDLLFEGIRSTVRGEIQSAITLAEKQITNLFAIRILKALFIVKYYSNFKTTARNVSVLMIDHINIDLKEHEKKVQEALNLLESQTYLQRNGDVYEYLTDDEKDIEEEIKSTDLDDPNGSQFLKELIFDEIIQQNKIKFIDNKQDYEFCSKIDGTLFGREKELVIDIITPNNDNYDNREHLKAQSMGYNAQMLMVLPSDDRIQKDIRLYLKTIKYLKQNRKNSNKESVNRILYEKGTQNAERRRTLINMLKKGLGEAEVYMNGSKHELNNSDGRTKVINAFQDLIKLAYPSLKTIGSTAFSEDTIRTVIRNKQDDIFGSKDNISEPENEVLNLINRRKKNSDRTSLLDVRDHFSKKPYGWYPNAIWTIIAKLYKRGKIEMRQDANLLGDDEVLEALQSNRAYANTLLLPQVDIDPKYVRALKDAYSEMFDQSCPATEAKEVALSFQKKLTEEISFIKTLVAQKDRYKFTANLTAVCDEMEPLSRQEPNYYLLNLKEFEDRLLDAKEDLLDPIKKFWNGEQKGIYDNIRTYLDGDQSNFDYVEGDELQKLREVYSHEKPYAGNLIREAKVAMDSLQTKVLDKLKEERTSAIQKLKQERDNLAHHEDFQQLEASQQQMILQPFDQQIASIEKSRYISNIRQQIAQASELRVQQLNEIQKLQARKDGNTNEPKVQYIRRLNVKVNFPKTELQTEADVEEYVQKYKEELLRHIQENRRITL